MNANIKSEAKAILEVCHKYGCGNVMEWASAIYRYRLKQEGLPPEHAFISVIPVLCNKSDEGITLGKETRELYDNLVQRLMEGEDGSV